MAGGTKGVPESVSRHPRAFVTLTAPSFGPVHSRRLSRRARVIPCSCGEQHREHDTRARHPARPGQLRLRRRRALAGPRRGSSGTGSPPHCGGRWPGCSASGSASSATTPGCPTPRSPSTSGAAWSTSTPSSASTARTDPPPHRHPASPATACNAAIRAAVDAAGLTVARPDGAPLALTLGPPGGHPADHPGSSRPARGPGHRRDHRRRPGRLRRQVRHQGHRQERGAPTGRSATSPTSRTSTSATTTAA